jgi:pyrimidine-nucleoside phosphorylase
MNAVEAISLKRDGKTLPDETIHEFIHAATHGTWPDYQLSAMLMAIYLKGMRPSEIATFTVAMTNSGDRFRWNDLPGPKLDKHSTGGVGDKTSLILAPLVAACGGIVPMMSGRGLGHSGGTLDKLESIPGFRVRLEAEEIRTCLKDCGMALFGQTERVAPADRKLYALRDVTGTVESMPLITASILSKKLAEGIDGLVLDVKCGNGAFMTDLPRARDLAESLVRVGAANGLATRALITGMEFPLGRTIGNALEISECIDVLRGEGPADLVELSLLLAAEMLVLGKLANSIESAMEKLQTALHSGRGLELFRRIVELQGGDPRTIDDPSLLPQAPHRFELKATRNGYITELHAKKIGLAGVRLGAGRTRAEDTIDPGVGIVLERIVGDSVHTGDPIMLIHYSDEIRLNSALELLEEAIHIADVPAKPIPLILESFGETK